MPRDDVEPLARPAVSYYTKKLDSAVSWLDVQSATSGLIPLAEWFRPQEAAALAWTLVPQLAKQKAPQVVTPLHKACEATVPKMARNDMVDLLKSPLCVGFARTVVLRELGRQAGENFGTVWDFVTWARRHEPDLDLLSPPQAHNG